MGFRLRLRQPAPSLIGGTRFDWGARTYVMGIVNVTPDSFSGDGVPDPARAIEQGLRFVDEGADLLDVGGESTRPGHVPVPAEEELRRVLPVIEGLVAQAGVPVSIDTYKAEVAREALDAGAALVNDVWGLKRGPEKAEAAARAGAALVLMHNQDRPEYSHLVGEVVASLAQSIERAQAAGMARDRMIVDPGIGFGKTWEHNLALLAELDALQALGLPVLVGTSRKSTIGIVLDLPVEERLEGTAATVALAIAKGADIVRVHDVRAMVRVARMSDAIVRGRR